jgi:hypothetical protein
MLFLSGVQLNCFVEIDPFRADFLFAENGAADDLKRYIL